MRNLLLFLLKNNSVFLFILLQVFALYILVIRNDKQGDIFLSSSNIAKGSFYERITNTRNYFSLRDQNDLLQEENKKLHERLLYLNVVNETKINNPVFINDSVFDQRYKIITADVVFNTTNKVNNYITINRGKKHGITKNSGVINQDGVVGVVKEVSEHYSLVMSVLNPNVKISAIIDDNNYYGELNWNAKDPELLNLLAIPKHVILKEGMKISTSGFSSMFPKGIHIGSITTHNTPSGSNFHEIQLKSSVDFKKVSYVYVIDDFLKVEKNDLINNSQND